MVVSHFSWTWGWLDLFAAAREGDEQRYSARYDRHGDWDIEILRVPRLMTKRKRKKNPANQYSHPRKTERRTNHCSIQERSRLTIAVLAARPTRATRATEDKLKMGVLEIMTRNLAIFLALGARLLHIKARADGLALLADACAELIGARESVGAARLSIGLLLVRGTRRRCPGAC